MTDAENPRAVIGANSEPDIADRITAQMAADYAALAESTSTLLAQVRNDVPDVIETEADNAVVAKFVADLRDLVKRAENHREAEKAPYLRGGQAVDSFFKSLTDRAAKALAIIKARGDDYIRRKIAEERAARARLAHEAEEKARAERDAAAIIARAAAELEAAAARARKPENIAALEAAATDKTIEAEVKGIDAMIARDQAETATLATMASSADIARTRYDNGRLGTAKQAPHVEIVDSAMLDKDVLWPLISEAEKLRALKQWGRLTAYKRPMPGAVVELRDAADYR